MHVQQGLLTKEREECADMAAPLATILACVLSLVRWVDMQAVDGCYECFDYLCSVAISSAGGFPNTLYRSSSHSAAAVCSSGVGDLAPQAPTVALVNYVVTFATLTRASAGRVPRYVRAAILSMTLAHMTCS